jgi:peptidoglycan hydrolase CwlO-like protein
VLSTKAGELSEARDRIDELQQLNSKIQLQFVQEIQEFQDQSRKLKEHVTEKEKLISSTREELDDIKERFAFYLR